MQCSELELEFRIQSMRDRANSLTDYDLACSLASSYPLSLHAVHFLWVVHLKLQKLLGLLNC